MGGMRLYYQKDWPQFVDQLNQGLKLSDSCVLFLDRPLEARQIRALSKMTGVLCFAIENDSWAGLEEWPSYIQGYIKDPANSRELEFALEQAKRNFELRVERDSLKFKLLLEKERRSEIMQSALELAEDREISSLCEKVLTKIRKLLSAEGASLYIYLPEESLLRFAHVQNEKLDLKFKEMKLPLDESSIVGACAVRKKLIHIPDVYRIDPDESFSFNTSFDKTSGYRTKNLLNIPLIKSNGDLVGIVQVINSKLEDDFSDDEIEIGRALSAHIAVAIETALLYQNIEELFEGFIKASVTAIESRDPTTSGHSERVALLTIGLAQEVHESKQKAFKSTHFNQLQMKELRYASLLHDFGKIGVPEKVLVKAKKLYPEQLDVMSSRFDALISSFPERRGEFEEIWGKILEANEPTVLVEDLKANLEHLLGLEFDILNKKIPLIKEEEWAQLSVKKGSLSEAERGQIESHVLHTIKFLEKIPWTGDLKRVPSIAAAHHEKLDGRGYPYGLLANKIPLESQIMAVADVYDALTAMDRPYKRAVSQEKALAILNEEAKRLSLNADLVTLFEQRRVFRCLLI
ncbi:MAG: phosphohydrolase [Deltaproteobacteria bacterium CG11_big_fil_rev_8_21_14_0_20_45_16]|nr:MAG: phosphohydrolase [Deltaproteobacteria bacterium CG11_big_fil_rev_8_21_14_0_20_45_16]